MLPKIEAIAVIAEQAKVSVALDGPWRSPRILGAKIIGQE